MNSNREELLFGLALLKPALERAAFLDRECADDAALRQRLEALLAVHDQPDPLLTGCEGLDVSRIVLRIASIPDATSSLASNGVLPASSS